MVPQVLHLTFLSFFIPSTLAQRFSILLTEMDHFRRIDTSLQFSFWLLADMIPKQMILEGNLSKCHVFKIFKAFS